MPPHRTVVALVVLLEACCVSAYPAYPKSAGAQGFNPASGAASVVAGSRPPAGPQPPRNLDQVLPAPADGVSQGEKGAGGNEDNSPLREDVPEHLAEDLHAVLWKMVVEGELQSPGLTQTELDPQQPSKRACFWKYCITK